MTADFAYTLEYPTRKRKFRTNSLANQSDTALGNQARSYGPHCHGALGERGYGGAMHGCCRLDGPTLRLDGIDERL